MNIIEPCPFCGSDTCETALTRWNPVFDRWRVVCGRGCNAEGPATDTEAEAITAWNTRIEHTPSDRNAVLELLREAAVAINVLEQTVRLLVPENILPDTSEARELLARLAALTTPEPTEPAGVAGVGEIPVCRSCGEPSPNGDPCETCVECERILAMSDEEVVAEAGPEGMAHARGFKEGLRAGLNGRTPPLLEVAKEALEQGAAWFDEYAEQHQAKADNPAAYYKDAEVRAKKAQRNRERAEHLRAALQAIKGAEQ